MTRTSIRTRTSTALTITAFQRSAGEADWVVVEISYDVQGRGSKIKDSCSYPEGQITDPDNKVWDATQPRIGDSELSNGALLYSKIYLFLLPEYQAESLFAIRQCCLLALETGEKQTLTITF